MTAVEVCPICDIAGCRHIRERKAKMTDKELDALVRLAGYHREHVLTGDLVLINPDGPAFADTITALRAQLAEAKADKEKLGRELNLARYGQPDFSWQVHKEAIAEANARADRAKAALAAQPSPDVAALVDLLEGWLAISENCEITNGVCCCGDDMDYHAEPMFCGHVAIDNGAYIAQDHASATRAAIARVKGGEA